MRNGLLGLLVGGMLVLAACGGSGTTGATTTPAAEAPAAESSAPADGGTSSGSQPSAEASGAVTTSEAPAGGGGGPALGVCDLVTADEVAGIFSVASVTMTVIPGPPDNCIIESDAGDPLAAWSLSTAQAKVVYDALTTDPATIDVPGIGDKAAIVQNTGLLVLKGDLLLVVSISGGADLSEEEGIAASKEIASIAAGRM